MGADREDYIPPVGFAREPALEVRRWIGRVLLVALMVLVLFILWNNVLFPNDSPQVPQSPALPN